MSVQKYKKLDDIIALAEFAHRNQTDQAGMPYIDHPRRVMQAVQAQGAQPYVQMAAILHDVTEDTSFTCQMLMDLGVPEPAVEIVKLVDRDHSKGVYEARQASYRVSAQSMLGYTDPIPGTADEFYYMEIRKNPGALQVKLADIGDNTLEYRLAYLSEARQDRLRDKYAKAREILLG